MKRLSAIVSILALVLLMASCQFFLGTGRMQQFEETETLKPHYSVEWPEDASRNPAHYHTSVKAGRLFTTVPIVEEETGYR